MSRWIALLLALWISVSQAQPEPDGNGWKRVTARDDIQVYRADDADQPIKTFRGVTLLPMEDFRTIGAVMDDYDFIASWLHMVTTVEGVRRVSATHRNVYVTTQLPWPIRNRDTPLSVKLKQRNDPPQLTSTLLPPAPLSMPPLHFSPLPPRLAARIRCFAASLGGSGEKRSGGGALRGAGRTEVSCGGGGRGEGRRK